MRQYRTLEAIAAVGALRQYLDSIRPHDRNTANMTTEFEHVLAPGEPDTFAPESTGTYTRAQLEAEQAELEAEDARDTCVMADKYASRRGENHWTRRRPSQGPTRKLADEGALYARVAYYDENERVALIADALQVTASTIYGVLAGRSHRREAAGWPTYSPENVRRRADTTGFENSLAPEADA